MFGQGLCFSAKTLALIKCLLSTAMALAKLPPPAPSGLRVDGLSLLLVTECITPLQYALYLALWDGGFLRSLPG